MNINPIKAYSYKNADAISRQHNKFNHSINFKQTKTPAYLSNVTKSVPRNKLYLGAAALLSTIVEFFSSSEEQRFKNSFDKKGLRMSRYYGEDCVNRILQDTYNIKKKLNLNLDFKDNWSYDSNDKYFVINVFGDKDKNRDSYYLTYDKSTGELLNIEINNNTMVLVKDNKIITLTPTNAVKKRGNNTFHETCLESCTTTTDLDGNFISATESVKSAIPGENNIFEYTSESERYQTVLSEIDNTGGKHIEKHLVSLDGTKTDYAYADDSAGNRYMYYKITDKDGNTLMEINDKFKVVDDNHFISTRNGLSYDIQFTDDKVIVVELDKNGDKTKEHVVYYIKQYSEQYYRKALNINNSLYNNLFGSFVAGLKDAYRDNDLLPYWNTVDKKLLPVLKQLSGEQWFALDSRGTSINYTYFNTCILGRSFGGLIELSPNGCNDISVLEHEIGHEKLEHLLDDKKFIEIYREELMLCHRLLPTKEVDYMSYYLLDRHTSNCLKECLAEINRIIHTPQYTEKLCGNDGNYLMKYFPRTIAYVSNIIQEKPELL